MQATSRLDQDTLLSVDELVHARNPPTVWQRGTGLREVEARNSVYAMCGSTSAAGCDWVWTAGPALLQSRHGCAAMPDVTVKWAKRQFVLSCGGETVADLQGVVSGYSARACIYYLREQMQETLFQCLTC